MTVKPRGLLLCCVLFGFSLFALQAQSAKDWAAQGMDAFLNQKTDQAIAYFEKARSADPATDEYFLYLGVLYQDAGRFESAEEQYSTGIALSGSRYQQLLFNRGNLRFSRGDFDGARQDYTKLIDEGGGFKASALLNRANLALNSSRFPDAIDDYVSYLAAEPDSPQRETIEKLLAMLNSRMASEEEARLLAEQRARAEEEARLAESARIAEEKARREAMMQEVLESLSGSGKETKSIRAGNESLRKDFEESELED